MKNSRRIKGEQNLQYNLNIWKKNDAFDILNEINEDGTLVQLVDSLGNFNPDISIVGYWIFYSIYNKALCFIQNILGIILYPSIGEELGATFQSVFYYVR